MADEKQDQPEATDPPAESLLGRARNWATGSRLRSLIVAGGLLGVTGGTVAVWLVLANMAAPHSVTRIETVLERLDAGELEIAATLVKRMQDEQAILTRDYGGPLFVLGAVRAKQAEQQWAPERRRRDYLVAARYLDEARALGVPEDREYEALYLLGKSYIGSDQLDEGVQVLTEALDSETQNKTEIHGMLAEAYYFASEPKYNLALEHLDAVLADPGARQELRDAALLRRARTLSRLHRDGEAERALAAFPESADPAQSRLVAGQVLLRAAKASGDSQRRAELLDRAEQALIEAGKLDKLATGVSAGAEFLLGRVDETRGRRRAALDRYTGVRKRYGMSAAGVAASIAEGDLLRADNDTEAALDAYRRALDLADEMTSYRSDLLPVADLRAAMLGAHEGFIGEGKFDSALTLLNQLEGLLGPTWRLELQAKTQQSSGEWLLKRSEENSWPLPELQREGRERLREAGVSYERLAEQRFATVKYPDDLWRAAEAYHQGQSYSRAVGLLQDYLKNEPLRYNAQALLRLGQSLLALGRLDEAIEAFEECVEFHPNDAAVYGSRLAAAKAHRDRGHIDQAEQLLRDNLLGGTLTPRSPEWRDSKFELGMLLHDAGRYTEAIDHLEEATQRYPDARQTRSARYTVAESYRRAAEAPRKRLEAKAVNEREQNEKAFRTLLSKALEHYDAVQREISRSGSNLRTDQYMLRNCYMLKGSVLFDLGRFDPGRYRQAVDEYSNVSALYQNEPFVLETLLQISYCWRRLGEPDKARGNIEQALLALERLPKEIDYLTTTSRSRSEWELLLNDIRDL